ncbi:MAG: hypothetical protein ACYS1A_10930 [Planctomycetota bacterium]|jgi:hypothetical protein
MIFRCSCRVVWRSWNRPAGDLLLMPQPSEYDACVISRFSMRIAIAERSLKNAEVQKWKKM